MKQLPPSGHGPERIGLRDRLQTLPFREWKADIIDYLYSISWTQWGFVAVATFGYLFYLTVSFSVGIFLATILFLIKLMLRVDWEESLRNQGVAYWIEWTFSQIIRPLIPRRVRAGAQRRAEAHRIHRLVLRGAVELAKPNRVTFVFGCVGLALLALAVAQHYWFPPSASVPAVDSISPPLLSPGVDYD